MAMEPKLTTQEEVDRNYVAFEALLPTLCPEHVGKFCLMRNAEMIEMFDTASDAYVAGNRLYSDGIFSIQEVREIPVDLGYFSHAIPCL